MTWTLICKLLRDLRWALLVTVLLLCLFQVLWAKTVERIVSEFTPLFRLMATNSGMDLNKIRNEVFFGGPNRAFRAMLGGEDVDMDKAQDLLSIGYVHPLIVVIFCIWSVGRASGALAGELDRGTMELLLAQPVPRWKLILAHFLVDVLTIPLLCLSLWGGNYLGVWSIGPEVKLQEINTAKLKLDDPPKVLDGPQVDLAALKFGPFRLALQARPFDQKAAPAPPRAGTSKRLQVSAPEFGRALPAVGGVLFAICGYTMWLSALGRFRWRVLGVAVLVTLLMFLVNLIGQMWVVMEPLRPFTLFYYYQPQQLILGKGGFGSLAMLYGVGVVGYGLALWTFSRRDLPAPL
jgi:ABC-2 type transport system permease protein